MRARKMDEMKQCKFSLTPDPDVCSDCADISDSWSSVIWGGYMSDQTPGYLRQANGLVLLKFAFYNYSNF